MEKCLGHASDNEAKIMSFMKIVTIINNQSDLPADEVLVETVGKDTAMADVYAAVDEALRATR